uniref:Photosystem I assembly protein Ycf4 n=1 Tax=Lepocinclis tripteris TaxID=135494 RepID=A0A3G3LKY4_9EUGL|nr:photosystem I assembly protein ycf4 [Lepocinclis tripteris]AYQ93369.1 photosystem I assembly protein ycf4 [Lepocinclis tripteris]
MEIKDNILKQKIINTEKLYDYLVNITVFLGSVGFLTAGISSYLNKNIIPFIQTNEISFIPQGLTMTFYGTLGLLISSYQILILYSNTGEGYNEFNKEKGTLNILRNNFPYNKTPQIILTYSINDIEAIKIKKINNIFNVKQSILICLKNNVEIPILDVRKPLNLNELEKEASELASFLQIPIRT